MTMSPVFAFLVSLSLQFLLLIICCKGITLIHEINDQSEPDEDKPDGDGPAEDELPEGFLL